MHRLISSPQRSASTNHATDREQNGQSTNMNKDNVGGHKASKYNADRSIDGFAATPHEIGIDFMAMMQLCSEMESNRFKVRLTFADRQPIDLRVMNLIVGIFISMCPLPLDPVTFVRKKAYGSLVVPLPPFSSGPERKSTFRFLEFGLFISEWMSIGSRLDSGPSVSVRDTKCRVWSRASKGVLRSEYPFGVLIQHPWPEIGAQTKILSPVTFSNLLWRRYFQILPPARQLMC